eukprot:5776956-Amphidinium_carterae.1
MTQTSGYRDSHIRFGCRGAAENAKCANRTRVCKELHKDTRKINVETSFQRLKVLVGSGTYSKLQHVRAEPPGCKSVQQPPISHH